MRQHFDVIVIGGGTTGTAIIRDLVLRGFTNSILLEREDLAAGTSGGCHSALHAGSRYVVSDRQTAIECLQENQVFRRIVPQVIDPTDSLWVCKTDEHLEYAKEWMKGADEIGLPYEIISVEEACEYEPALSKDIKFAIRAIDTGFDPFRLCIAQAYDAETKGATIRTHQEVVGLIQDEDNNVIGVRVLDKVENRYYEIETDLVINASGPWGSQITEMAGFKIPIRPNKGTTAIYGMRPTRALTGFLRYPADGDGLVSQGYQNTSLLGTSSVDIEDPDDAPVSLEEIKIMEDSVVEIIPEIRNARMIRTCTGVRPLYTESEERGRNISRGTVLLDHDEREGVKGLITITGGKYATARLMAEETVDLACEKLVGRVIPCVSDKQYIYGAQTKEDADADARLISEKYSVPLYAAHKFTARYGAIAKEIAEKYPEDMQIVDESVQILGSEVRYSIEEESVVTFDDMRRRIRNGMGQDQGTFSSYKVGYLYQDTTECAPSKVRDKITEYQQERWKGVSHTIEYGDQLPTSTLMQSLYVGMGSYDVYNNQSTRRL